MVVNVKTVFPDTFLKPSSTSLPLPLFTDNVSVELKEKPYDYRLFNVFSGRLL
jgi:hypothetical protein